MEEVLTWKSIRFGRAMVEVPMTQCSSFNGQEEWFIISGPKKKFRVSSPWENHKNAFYKGSNFQGWTPLPVSPGSQNQRSNTQILTSLLYLSLMGSPFNVCHHVENSSWHLFLLGFSSTLSCPHFSLQPLHYHWWHPANENGSNYFAVGLFNFYV